MFAVGFCSMFEAARYRLCDQRTIRSYRQLIVSLPEDKLTGDLGNVIEATSIGGRRSDFFTSGKLALGNLGLLQQYRHKAAEAKASNLRQLLGQ
jgi:hypothetical protein